jgi:hypothetical protein
VTSFRDNLTALTGRYPITDAFIEELRVFVESFCKLVPVKVYNMHRAERRLEQAACEAIVLFWQDKFGEESWFPVTVHPGWPRANCIIKTKPTPKAVISFQIGPETDGERGGVPIEAIEFAVTLKPPNVFSRMLNREKREPELAPVGTPDGRPELKLNRPVQRPAATTKPPQPRPAPKPPSKPVPPTTPPKATARR